MSFDDLPENWSGLPLDTPGLAADVADLFVGLADRESGCLAFLIADEARRLVQPCLVGGVPEEADPWDIHGFLARLTPMIRSIGGALLFVRGRPGSVLFTDTDREWHEAVLRACRDEGVPLLGAYLATPAAVRPFPRPLAEGDVIAS